MGVPTIKTGPMTVEEFYAFTDTRPDEEKWELIDGEPILNASPQPIPPVDSQKSCDRARYIRASGEPQARGKLFPGLGVRVSDTSRPEPDVLIIPQARSVTRSL